MRAISVKGHGGGAREVRSRVQGRRRAAGTRHLPGLRCCNRAATGAGRTRTEQENNGAKNTENRLYKRHFRQGRTERLRRFEGLIGVPLLVAKTRSLSW
jgi:hypothetical protein